MLVGRSVGSKISGDVGLWIETQREVIAAGSKVGGGADC